MNEENLNKDVNEEVTSETNEVKEEVVTPEVKEEEKLEVEETTETKSPKGFELPKFGQKKTTKRVLRGDFVALVALVLIVIISAVKIPSFLVDSKLEKLGYNEKAIEAIKDKKISKVITSNGYYSDYLASEVVKDSFKTEYLELYVYETKLDDEDFAIYEKLQKMGYTEEEALKIFKELDNQEISALLVFDKQTNLDTYIADCKKNRAMNKNGGLILSGDYFKAYENIQPAPGIGTDAVLVNKKHDLGKYVPEDLKTLNTRYAIDGVMLVSNAHEAFVSMCNDMSSAGLGIYSIGGYRSYEDQKEYYEYYDTKAEADLQSIRPGFSESQTGLSVQVVDGTNESLDKFGNSPEYKWLQEHAHEYGFILRYPANKQSVTGHEGETYRYRYVGKDLATKIKNSGLTLEEYYALYMNDVTAAKPAKDNK